MPDIFLSYNREDQARAKQFAEAFEAQGFTVWWDVGLRTGEAYDQVTEKAIKTAKAVVVLWSKKSVESRWVRAEATLADRNKTLVPCMIERCERPIMFELTQTAELSHWQGETTDRVWVGFLADVARFVARDAAPAAPVAVSAPASVQETLKPGQTGSAPSLAVLPFTNRSGLPEDEVFAQGMVEDVISALSEGVNVRVLGSTATASLSRAANTDLMAVGRQLGVQYLLEGNVRRAGANLRVTTQLLDATTAAVMWTAKFDRPLSELAALQEELVLEIAARLDAQVIHIEMERVLKKPGDITAWEALMRGFAAFRNMDAAGVQRGAEEAARAIAIAPDYGPAHAALANSLATLYLFASADNPAEERRIRAIAERALALAPEDGMVLGQVGNALGLLGFPEEGVRHTGRAVRKAPGSGMEHHFHGSVCLMANRPAEALPHFDTAARLMPGSHVLWLVKYWRALALGELERWEEAEEAIDESIGINPIARSYAIKARVCAVLGREAEALRNMATARRLGSQLKLWERTTRRIFAGSPRLEENVATMRRLFAATE